MLTKTIQAAIILSHFSKKALVTKADGDGYRYNVFIIPINAQIELSVEVNAGGVYSFGYVRRSPVVYWAAKRFFQVELMLRSCLIQAKTQVTGV